MFACFCSESVLGTKSSRLLRPRRTFRLDHQFSHTTFEIRLVLLRNGYTVWDVLFISEQLFRYYDVTFCLTVVHYWVGWKQARA